MTLSRRLVQAARRLTFESLVPEVVAKVKICLLDYLSCAYESLDLPWSLQAMQIAAAGPAAVVGSSQSASPADAAFVNAILGHGLVREDMHTGSVSHLGVVMFPTLLALAEGCAVKGRDYIAGIVC